MRAVITNPWSGWDVIAQAGEVAAGVDRQDDARRIFEFLVQAIRSRFIPFV